MEHTHHGHAGSALVVWGSPTPTANAVLHKVLRMSTLHPACRVRARHVSDELLRVCSPVSTWWSSCGRRIDGDRLATH